MKALFYYFTGTGQIREMNMDFYHECHVHRLKFSTGNIQFFRTINTSPVPHNRVDDYIKHNTTSPYGTNVFLVYRKNWRNP